MKRGGRGLADTTLADVLAQSGPRWRHPSRHKRFVVGRTSGWRIDPEVWTSAASAKSSFYVLDTVTGLEVGSFYADPSVSAALQEKRARVLAEKLNREDRRFNDTRPTPLRQ